MATFKNIRPGARVTFSRVSGCDWHGKPIYRTTVATVNPLLIFPGHVVVNHGSFGTVVDERNYIGHRPKKEAA